MRVLRFEPGGGGRGAMRFSVRVVWLVGWAMGLGNRLYWGCDLKYGSFGDLILIDGTKGGGGGGNQYGEGSGGYQRSQ